ncbi:hypothetical protein [Chitinophaga tropicalis]|uniref:Uncharacterized protein n=1 Tax=Chitinophaga tropicalis TaxID=2683588 RepID=A0A7K1U5Q3_9BACT|nr:hypothetical protein [Chitinophaga tropicalis]MVT09688.1 hypothetical protein [Chitinophaga tropicalis]
MEIIPTFGHTRAIEDCHLWTVCYPEELNDAFTNTFNKWNDTSYLVSFFEENNKDLNHPFWNSITIDEAIDQVREEARQFMGELRRIEMKKIEEGDRSLKQIFQALHKEGYILISQNVALRKGKAKYPVPPMLRLYGIALEDSCIVITGGAIKITPGMDRPHLEEQKRKLSRVQFFLKQEGIDSRDGVQ